MRSVVLVYLLGMVACAPAARGPVRFTPATTSREWSSQQRLTSLLRASTPYAPLDSYGAWWNEVRVICECKPKLQLDALQWRSIVSTGLYERGEYWGGIDVVFILSADTHTPSVVQHEMLHAMLGGDESHQHRAWRRLKRST